MKFKLGLTLAFILACPGAWAVIAWTLADVETNGKSMGDMIAIYRKSFPLFAGAMKTTIICLAVLSFISVALCLYLNPGESRRRKTVRLIVLCIGLFSGALLCFALM